jgi:hypothetical protein
MGKKIVPVLVGNLRTKVFLADVTRIYRLSSKKAKALPVIPGFF